MSSRRPFLPVLRVLRDLRGEASSDWCLAVLLPWALSRGAVDVVAVGASAFRERSLGAIFNMWDGVWYARIAQTGYGFVNAEGQTPYPFFPLLPWLLRAGEAFGLSPTATGVALTHICFLIALAGVYGLARAHGTPREAALATWFLALNPGSSALALIYPDVIFLAFNVWGFRALGRGHEGIAATLAAGAALVRPNGIVLAASLAFAASRGGSLRRAAIVALPAIGCLASWLLWLWTQTGDPLIFVYAKAQWHEVTLASLLVGSDPMPWLDISALGFAVSVLTVARRRLPPEWLLLAALSLLPSLAFGIVGMPRFAASCFPVAIAAGIILARFRAPQRVAALAALAATLLVVTWRVLLGNQMP